MAELKPTEKSSVTGGICKNCNNHIREKLVELLNNIKYMSVDNAAFF